MIVLLIILLAVLLYFLLRREAVTNKTKRPPPEPHYHCKEGACSQCDPGASSDKCPFTTVDCDGKCTSPSYDGDGKASTTYFTAGRGPGPVVAASTRASN